MRAVIAKTELLCQSRRQFAVRGVAQQTIHDTVEDVEGSQRARFPWMKRIGFEGGARNQIAIRDRLPRRRCRFGRDDWTGGAQGRCSRFSKTPRRRQPCDCRAGNHLSTREHGAPVRPAKSHVTP